MQQNALITIIVPFKYNSKRSHIIDRIANCKLDQDIPSSIDFVLVDYYDNYLHQNEVIDKCRCNSINYMSMNSDQRIFSIAKLRNWAAMRVSSPYIMFMDMDLIPYDGFYKDLINEIEINDLNNNTRDIIGFGVIYLTEYGYESFNLAPQRIRKNMFIQHLIETNERYIEKFSTGTSVQLIDRQYYLRCGGNNENFCGWGFEDIEFTLRLALKSKQFPIPKNLILDYKNCKNIVEFKGFKSLTRLFGDITFSRGIVLFHQPHQIDSDDIYMKLKDVNKKIFEDCIKDFMKNGKEPPPLSDLSAGNTLLFTYSHPAIHNIDITPRLGKIFYINEEELSSDELLREYIDKYEINLVILQNPYSNENRRSIYNYVRKYNIPYYVVERGALPNSIFFDSRGFNADSQSYSSIYWDHVLNIDERNATIEYIELEKVNDEYLESQPKRVGRSQLIYDLNINKKMLLIPLQTSSDTVIKYFCDDYIKSFDEFIDLIHQLNEVLPQDWMIVYKNHPLTKNPITIENATCADIYNIKDLIDASSCILLINSGVGLLSMLFNKPVLYTGKVFYGHDQLNKKVNNLSEIITNLNSLFTPCKERALRFLNYLIHDFYSFGLFKTKIIDWSGESNMTITQQIDFYQINNIGKTKYIYDYRRNNKYDYSSILFDRYRYEYELNCKNKQGSTIRKLKKLLKNPYLFFAQSKFKILRKLKHFFK